MKKLLVLALTVLVGCSIEKETESISFVPERFTGSYVGVQTDLAAEVKHNRLRLQTEYKTLTITKGTITEDNGDSLCIIQSDDYEIILLRGNGYVGITVVEGTNTILSDYYEKI